MDGARVLSAGGVVVSVISHTGLGSDAALSSIGIFDSVFFCHILPSGNPHIRVNQVAAGAALMAFLSLSEASVE